MSENTFGDYKFPAWVPKHTREIIVNFWGQSGRDYENWLDNVKHGERDFCYHGPNPDGFGNPPNGAKATYCISLGGVNKVVTGRYLHRWNNMGSLIVGSKDYTVSSCDEWVRVFRNKTEREKILTKHNLKK